MLRADLVVVGAGPAGTAAAVAAARRGMAVEVFDRATFPRDKCCGDGLTTGALRRLEGLGLDPTGLASWQPVETAHVRIPDGRMASLALPTGEGIWAATLRRRDLDAAMVDLARRAGAEVHEGLGAAGVDVHHSGWLDVTLDDGETVRAGYVVAADGMWSPLRKAAGLAEPGYRGEWHALRQYFRGTSPAASDLWVWFEDDLRPGYVWSFPLPGGGANVGYGVRREAGRPAGAMKAQWEEILARPHIAEVIGSGAEAEGPLRTWPIPARIDRTTLSAAGGRLLFAGDAARAPDSMTGEGIAQALETGELAARSAAACGPAAPLRAAAAYRAAIRRGMAIDERVSRAFSKVLCSERGANAWFGLANHSARTRYHFARWMFEDYPRAGLVTPWRWKRGMLGSPGAFQASVAR